MMTAEERNNPENEKKAIQALRFQASCREKEDPEKQEFMHLDFPPGSSGSSTDSGGGGRLSDRSSDSRPTKETANFFVPKPDGSEAGTAPAPKEDVPKTMVTVTEDQERNSKLLRLP